MKTLVSVLALILAALIIQFLILPGMYRDTAVLTEAAVSGVIGAANRLQIQNVGVSIVTGLLYLSLFAATCLLARAVYRAVQWPQYTPVIALVLFALMSAACSPTTEYVVVESNEAAFAVPNDSESAGASVDRSETYWQAIRDLRTSIPISRTWRSTGGFLNLSGVWVPSHTVIKVSTMEVSREWNNAASASDSDQSFSVESLDSQGISVGAVITARIEPENAALYLANFGTIPTNDQFPTIKIARPLSEVLDGVIRDRLQTILDREHGGRTINQSQNNKAAIWELARVELTAYAATQGVTILVLGGLDGMIYDNAEIQEAIDRSYIREEEQNSAMAGATQTAIYNTSLIGSSNAAATATVIAGRAAADVQRMQAEALAENPDSVYLEAVRRWNGVLPAIMDSDTVLPYMPPAQLTPQPTFAPTPSPTPAAQ
jgi:regulator of protease activity HflC (stomatin/prohibitin superfamily)